MRNVQETGYFSMTRRLALRPVVNALAVIEKLAIVPPGLTPADIGRLDRDRVWRSPRHFLLRQQQLGEVGPAIWLVETLEDNRQIGMCGVHRIKGSATSPLAGEYELACWLHPAVRLQGYAHEAACEALRCAFSSFLFLRDDAQKRVWARVARADGRARRLVERLGMTRKDAPITAAPDGSDCHLYALDALDFRRRVWW